MENETKDFYTDDLDPDLQIQTEEDIASIVFESDAVWDEEECADLGRAILKLVLKKFRPDLFVKNS